MESVNAAATHSSANRGSNAQTLLKAYNAPQFRILTPLQAWEELSANGLPEDDGAKRLLKVATFLATWR
jgi:hypothetical protein